MANIGIIIGSVREPRRGLTVGNWVLNQSMNNSSNYTILDLKEYDLPHYNEPGSPSSSKDYIHETTRRWSEAVNSQDGFIFVTPEYNGFFPGAIKDAVDYLYHEWKNKPFAVVGYGGRGAKWASGHLATLLKRFDMPDCGFVGVHEPWTSINANGEIDSEFIEGDLTSVFSLLNEHIE